MISSTELRCQKNAGFENIPLGLQELLFKAEDMAATLTKTQISLSKRDRKANMRKGKESIRRSRKRPNLASSDQEDWSEVETNFDLTGYIP